MLPDVRNRVFFAAFNVTPEDRNEHGLVFERVRPSDHTTAASSSSCTSSSQSDLIASTSKNKQIA
ncbi:unnamed protein product, partial [Rotaria socialis]